MEDTPLRPDRLVELANAFRSAKALMSSVELGVFAALAGSALCGDDLRLQLGLAERGARDFFETVLRPAIGSLQIHSIVASSRSKRRHTPTMRATSISTSSRRPLIARFALHELSEDDYRRLWDSYDGRGNDEAEEEYYETLARIERKRKAQKQIFKK